MIRTMLMLALLTLTGVAQAATIKTSENVNVLAARDAKMNALAKSITVNAGEQALIVRFEASANPGSSNESLGRVTSDAWLLTFSTPQNGAFTLSTNTPRTAQEARRAAEQPRFTLKDARGDGVALNAKKVNIAQSSLMTDYSQYLPGGAVARPSTASTQEGKATLSQAQREFLKLNAADRKAFLRWALEL